MSEMGTVKQLAEAVRQGLEAAMPGLRKTILKKLPLAVGAMLEAQTANTMALAAVLPLASERLDMRAQWLMRLLSNPRVDSATVMAPFARAMLAQAATHGQVVALSLDQTEVGDRFAVLMVSVRLGERALPLAWRVATGAANLGFAFQRAVLTQVQGWLPPGADVLLLADRFYPSAALLRWLAQVGWRYRLRLKRNLSVDTGQGEVLTTGQLVAGRCEGYWPEVTLFKEAVPTHLGMWQDPGHREPWIIAMECRPTPAAVRDYGLRWSIEPMFSDFKSRGFGLEDTQLQRPDRLDRLLLIMALAMYWCVRTGRQDAQQAPTPTEKKPRKWPATSTMAGSKKRGAHACPTSHVA